VADLLFAPFLAYAMDALINSAGKLRAISGGQFCFPLVVMGMTGTGWCVGGQHNHNLEAMFAHTPGLKVVMPSQPADFHGLLKAAIRDPDPVLYFMDMALLHEEGEVPDDAGHLIPLGRAELRRGGGDVTLAGYAKTVVVCEKAAAALAEQGVEAEVVDLHSLKPLDRDTVLASVRKTGRAAMPWWLGSRPRRTRCTRSPSSPTVWPSESPSNVPRRIATTCPAPT
jgi:pyruvate dehydrogenase E1 component beta subunit